MMFFYGLSQGLCRRHLSLVRSLSRMAQARQGLVLGVYEPETSGGDVPFTVASQVFPASAKLQDTIKLSGLDCKKGGKSRVFYGLDDQFPSLAVVKIGKKGTGYNELEEVEEGRENVRIAVAAGVKRLQDEGVKVIQVDPCSDAEAAAEGAYLASWAYDELKCEDKKKLRVELSCYTEGADDKASVLAAWERGKILAEGQNFARRLMDSPANVMTPTRFSELAQEYLGPLENVTVNARDRAWAEGMKMGSFLSVSAGSAEPPMFVEVSYNGGQKGAAPFAIVGKGITFDSGGISLKPPPNMSEMRADMGGAACTLASIYTAARLKLPVNVMGFMAMSENMPGGKATKPGDVVKAMNGKSIQIDNTDAEGRLVLADALCYAQTFNPSGIIDMATLTGAMMIALGASAAGAFTNSTQLWTLMHKAGTRTGDRVWRMPLFKHYSKFMTECHLADVNNLSSDGRIAGACTATAFLREFVTHDKWMHMDIAGVMSNKSEVPYLCAGMTGRPTRTIVEFLNSYSSQS